jgi:hypothetical protein
MNWFGSVSVFLLSRSSSLTSNDVCFLGSCPEFLIPLYHRPSLLWHVSLLVERLIGCCALFFRPNAELLSHLNNACHRSLCRVLSSSSSPLAPV